VTIEGVAWKIRGTNIETELRETPADFIVFDERDKMNEDNIPHALARFDGSLIARVYELSTPTVEGFGVYRDNGYPASDQMQWWIPCPHCGSKQVLSFEDNIQPYLGDTVAVAVTPAGARTAASRLRMLSAPLPMQKASGCRSEPQAETRGYHLTQLNSPTKTLADPQLGVLVNWFEGQRDSKKLKEFFNLGLGLAYSSPGDKFTVELLDKARGLRAWLRSDGRALHRYRSRPGSAPCDRVVDGQEQASSPP
jgi:phage terminase large subunit GpA-like protein